MKLTNIAFPEINRGYNNVFRPNRLSVGLVVPIENYNNSPVPSMGTPYRTCSTWLNRLGLLRYGCVMCRLMCHRLAMQDKCSIPLFIWVFWRQTRKGSHSQRAVLFCLCDILRMLPKLRQLQMYFQVAD